MTHCHGGVGAFPFLHEQYAKRFAHNVAPAADDHVLSVGGVAVAQKELLDPARRGGQVVGIALGELANVDRMYGINVLLRAYGHEHLGFIHVLWKGKLYQDAVKAVVAIKPLYQLQKFLLSGAFRQVKSLVEHAYLMAGTPLVAHVDCRCSIIPHQNGRQTGRHAVLLLHLLNASGYLGADLFGCSCTVQYLCHCLGRHDPPRRVGLNYDDSTGEST